MSTIESGIITRSRLGLLSEVELAAALNIGTSTLQSWRSSGSGPPFRRLGKGIFYHVTDVSEWTVRQRVNPGEIAA
jgi:hypothetical protein